MFEQKFIRAVFYFVVQSINTKPIWTTVVSGWNRLPACPIRRPAGSRSEYVFLEPGRTERNVRPHVSGRMPETTGRQPVPPTP
jgi:hypothetical protein